MKSQDYSDQELVRMFIAGDQSALEVLIHRHKSKLFRYINKLVKNDALAEDIFQDTFVRAINSLRQGGYKDDGRFGAWLGRIGHNLVIDHFRKLKNFRMISNDSSEIDYFNNEKFSDRAVDIDIAEAQVGRDLRELIEELPEEQKSIVKMRLNMKMSFKEIADFHDISINTALGRMRYAIINIRKGMKEHQYSLQID